MDLSVVAVILFALSMAAICYVYAGYPILVYLLAAIRPKETVRAPIEPAVTLVITAFNEEKDIRRKIENTLALDYPAGKLEVIVASDCSNDATDTIVAEFAEKGVRLVRQNYRGGKTAAQNLAVENANGEIVHFSDATSIYEPDVIRKLIANFADPSVGCVAGKLIYVDPKKTSVGSGARSYWSYETTLKSSESLACSLIGVSGCIYSVRKSNYRPMYPEACSDFLIATEIYRQGLRTVYEPSAVCIEETNQRSDKEMRMRVRVISQTFTDLWRNLDMLNPLKSGFFAIQLISHKLLRYSVPIFLLTALGSSGYLAFGSKIFLAIFLAQIVFYLSAAAGWLIERAGFSAGPLAIPFYFVLACIASVGGFVQFLRGERYAAWEPIRETGQRA